MTDRSTFPTSPVIPGGKVPPHSLEAERAVLGGIFLRPSAFDDVSAVLTVDSFFLPAHREIFDAMLAVTKRGRQLDTITVGDELKVRGMTSRLPGGDLYLTELLEAVPTAENIGRFARMVAEKDGMRRLIAACNETVSRAYGEGQLDELSDGLSDQLLKLQVGSSESLTYLRDVLPGVVDDIEKRAERGPDVVTGVRFGVTKVDRKLGGCRPGSLVIVAAGTGGGKTALAQQAGILNCLDVDPDTGLRGATIDFSLEMPKVELAERALAHHGEINSESLRHGDLTFDDWKRKIHPAQEGLSELDFAVEDEAFTLRDIWAKSRAFRGKHARQRTLVIVDFLQLVDEQVQKGENVARAVGRVAKVLKKLAKKLACVVIAISQFHRVPEGREPNKYDLKESGDIEQAADVILIIHNPDQTEDGPVLIIADKSRSGCPRFKAAGHWAGRHYRFSDPTPEDEDIVAGWQREAA